MTWVWSHGVDLVMMSTLKRVWLLSLLSGLLVSLSACGGDEPTSGGGGSDLEFHRCSCNSLDNFDVEIFTVCSDNPVGAALWQTNDLNCATKGGCTGCQCVPQQMSCNQDGCFLGNAGCG